MLRRTNSPDQRVLEFPKAHVHASSRCAVVGIRIGQAPSADDYDPRFSLDEQCERLREHLRQEVAPARESHNATAANVSGWLRKETGPAAAGGRNHARICNGGESRTVATANDAALAPS